jgi:ATP-dependent RNA helicase RhlE
MSDFKSLKLNPIILEALNRKGYTTPTPIQAKAIPHLLEGRDLLGIAQTGTGKTAAFSLPLINRLAKNTTRPKAKKARALIITPTRELASQINANVSQYSQGLKLTSAVVFGGVGKSPQIKALRGGLDVLVATPGRLLDLMNEKHVAFDELEVLILDEADRMLDMGFIRDIKKILAKLPKVKQTLLFSATMPKDIASLATSLLNSPVRVEVTPESSTVDKITQSVNFVAKGNKPLLLKHIIENQDITSVLVFSRTKHGADRIVKYLDRNSIEAAAIHGNKSQGARERALDAFKKGKIKILIATDIAARGIDVDHVSHVINYDLPNDPESYVHRIGRTARAGREGVAIAFCDDDELKLLRGVERFIKQKVPADNTHAFFGVKPPVKKHRPQSNRPHQKRNVKAANKTATKASGNGPKKAPAKREDSNKAPTKAAHGNSVEGSYSGQSENSGGGAASKRRPSRSFNRKKRTR